MIVSGRIASTFRGEVWILNIFRAEPLVLLATIETFIFRHLAGCTPIYPEKLNINLNKNLTTVDDIWGYEADGPLFELTASGQAWIYP